MSNNLPDPRPDNRFGSNCRLGGGSILQNTLRGGQRVSAAGIGITYCKSDSCRFGVGATKGFGNAVKRNRIKRVIREYLRLNKNTWPGSYNIFIRIFGKQESEKAAVAALESLLKKINRC
jgi:ribonuclease P protein component